MGAEGSKPEGVAVLSHAPSLAGPISPSREDELPLGLNAAAHAHKGHAGQLQSPVKRPGGSGMAVPPQRAKAPGGMPMRAAMAMPQSSGSPKAGTQIKAGSKRDIGNAEVPVEPDPDESRQQHKKQELVKKLNGMVSSMARQPGGTGAGTGAHAALAVLPGAATTPPAYAPDPGDQAVWAARVSASREDAMVVLRELQDTCYNEPLSPARVSGCLSDSLGTDLEQFSSYQGTIHNMMQKGLNDDMLEGFLFDEEAERQLTTYDKWATIRQAAEQVLQVYANRSNSSWIEAETWAPPNVVQAAGIVAGTSYSAQADRMLSRGEVALLFIDDGRLVERGGDVGPSPLLSTDLWQAIKELAPNKVPSTQRLERLSVVGRQLLHAAVSLEMWYGPEALSRVKAVVAVDADQESFLGSELLQWGHFGFSPSHLAVLPLPRFHGVTEEAGSGRLAHVKNSSKLLMGSGYALFLTNAPAEAYTLSESGDPIVLPDSVLGWLERSGASWVQSGLLADMERLHAGAAVDTEFLAAAFFSADTAGANMAMEVMRGESERDARAHDSIVLRRVSGTGSNAGSELSLRPSCMRTVRSYQIIQEHLGAQDGFYVATQRFVFKIPALRNLLVDVAQFKADVRLHSFYAYASFDLADVAGFAGAKCVCVGAGGRKGPCMTEVVCAPSWLNYVAPILEEQDHVEGFRQKAVQLIRSEGLVRVGSTAEAGNFKERKRAFTVVIPVTLEQARLAVLAIKMARLFIKNIVDRLHLLVVLGPNETKLQASTMLSSLGDKELDFQGQIVRSSLYRGNSPKDIAAVADYCESAGANVVVVPSAALCAPTSDLGAATGSLALAVCRTVTTLPVLVVKANSIGKFSNARTVSGAGAVAGMSSAASVGPRPGLVAMCHLDMSHASPLIEALGPFLSTKSDTLYLAKTQAFEPRSDQLTMRSRRMFVQARMAAPNGMRVEERAYGDAATAELPRAVDAEGVDVLMLAGSGSLPPSKEAEDLLKTVRCCVYIHRGPDVHRLGGAASLSSDSEL